MTKVKAKRKRTSCDGLTEFPHLQKAKVKLSLPNVFASFHRFMKWVLNFRSFLLLPNIMQNAFPEE
jgi:hypothetical protein